jgi:Na+-transporting NADH:ubiquinone oxidoreductase subunit NqrB
MKIVYYKGYDVNKQFIALVCAWFLQDATVSISGIAQSQITVTGRIMTLKTMWKGAVMDKSDVHVLFLSLDTINKKKIVASSIVTCLTLSLVSVATIKHIDVTCS